MSNESSPVVPVQNFVHTPGPWKYHSAGVMVLDGDGQTSIADIRGWGRLEKVYGEQKAMEIQDANGRLIAAAPEMLRIIQRLVTADWIGEAELNLWRKECRDIISKVV